MTLVNVNTDNVGYGHGWIEFGWTLPFVKSLLQLKRRQPNCLMDGQLDIGNSRVTFVTIIILNFNETHLCPTSVFVCKIFSFCAHQFHAQSTACIWARAVTVTCRWIGGKNI